MKESLCSGCSGGMRCVLVCLAVMATAFHKSEAMCEDLGITHQHGDIILRGISTANLKAGYIEMCVGSLWRALCDTDWGNNDGRVACRQLGFSGGFLTYTCKRSCLGRSNLTRGIKSFDCNGEDGNSKEGLNDCRGSSANTNEACAEYAGVVCSNRMRPECPTPQPPPPTTDNQPCTSPDPQPGTSSDPQTCTCPECQPSTCPESTTTQPPVMGMQTNTSMERATTMETSTNTDSTTGAEDKTRTMSDGRIRGDQQSCLALGGGLGALSVILAILLVGVAIGWAWSCHRRARKSGNKKRSLRTFQNPSYTTTTPSSHAPSTQYSALGPRDTPLNPSPTAAIPSSTYDIIRASPQGEEERIYQVLEAPGQGEGEGEGDYEEPGEEGEDEEEEEGGLTYEVPISTKAPAQQAAQQQESLDTEYSTLQHK